MSVSVSHSIEHSSFDQQGSVTTTVPTALEETTTTLLQGGESSAVTRNDSINSSEQEEARAAEDNNEEPRPSIGASTSFDSLYQTLTTSSSLLAHEQGMPSSSSQQRAPQPEVLNKKAKSIVSRLIPRRPMTSSANRANGGRTFRGTLQRSKSSTLSNRSVSSSHQNSGPLMPRSSGAQVAPFSKSSIVEPGLSLPWNKFRRQTTASTFLSFRSYSSRRLDATEYDDEEGGDLIAMQNKRTDPLNVLEWLTLACPTDVLPHIMAFCGPQTTKSLSGVNRFWANFMRQESTWRILCEDMYKWKEGDAEPSSWKNFYRENPCVPIDYRSVHKALSANSENDVHVWLRPGNYYLKKSIDINRNPEQTVSLSSMSLPSNIYRPDHHMINVIDGDSTTEKTHSKRRGRGLLKYILCTSTAYNDAAIDEQEDSEVSEQDDTLVQMPKTPKRATLVMKTKSHNEPVVRVQRGKFTAKNINIEHSCLGLDIWNGNTAIQVQPPQNNEVDAPILPDFELPVAELEGLRVTSRSGRGVVTIDGGQLSMSNSSVYDCAATGVYVGGRGTRARVSETDVLHNGLGSRGSALRHGGIARNHSGIYLEQGVAEILNCNVSNNTLTGITAVANENATLILRDSDLLGNGSFQLEIPAMRGRNITMHQNRLESTGTGRNRAVIED